MTDVQSFTAPPRVPRTARPKLLFFVSGTSGRSRRVEGFLAQVLQRRGNHETFDLVRIDADERRDLLSRFGVPGTPALLVVDGGHILARLTEPTGCKDITTALSPWLK